MCVQPRGIPDHIHREMRFSRMLQKQTTQLATIERTLQDHTASMVDLQRQVDGLQASPDQHSPAVMRLLESMNAMFQLNLPAIQKISKKVDQLMVSVNEMREQRVGVGGGARAAAESTRVAAGTAEQAGTATPATSTTAAFSAATYQFPARMSVEEGLRLFYLGARHVSCSCRACLPPCVPPVRSLVSLVTSSPMHCWLA